MPALRRALARSAIVGAGLALTLALLPAAPAAASLGSVPADVSAYVTGGGMLARLEQLYGPGVRKGSGVDFAPATTTTGPVSRVYDWTADRYAHADSTHPIQLTNYWTVPISVSGTATGVAAIWINPQSDQPELADFTASRSLATALANVPADAALVHDSATAAWFAVAGDTANPLVPGRSGVTTATPVADLALTRPTTAVPAAAAGNGNGIALAILVLILLIVVIVGAVVLPSRLRRPARTPRVLVFLPPEPVASPEQEAEAEPESEAESTTEAPPEAEPEPAPAPKPRAPRPKSPVTQKPAVSKPAGTKPAARAASTKPRPSRPPRPPQPPAA